MRSRLLILAVTSCLVSAACGLPHESDAQVVGQDGLPLPLATSADQVSGTAGTTAPAPSPSAVRTAVLYLVRDSQAVPVNVPLDNPEQDLQARAGVLLDLLKAGPGQTQQGLRLTSRLVGENGMHVVRLDGGTAVVALGPEPESATETRDGLWTAQVVLTLTDLPGIVAVRFQGVHGTPRIVLPDGRLVTGDIVRGEVASALQPPPSPTAARTSTGATSRPDAGPAPGSTG